MVKLCRQDNIEKYKIEYDLFNRMVKYTKGTDVYTYTYNGDGQRMSKTAHGFTTKFVWDGKNMVYEYIDAMNNTWYYYGNGVEVQLSADNLKEMEVYNKNAYGDIVSVNGWQTLYVVGMEFSYDAYGNEIEEYYNADGYAGCSFRYRGEYYDGETGFYYLRNRYYDPKKGRFITEDPIRDGTNWYTYCAGNPVMFVDPMGTDAIIITNENAVGVQGVATAGHTSAIYQDDQGEWYFTYWGNKAAAVIHIPIDSMQSLDEFNNYLKSYLEQNGYGNITTDYTSATYIVGDFTKSLDSAYNAAGGLETKESVDAFNYDGANNHQVIFQGENKSYNLASRNCLQQTILDFGKGTLIDGTSAKAYLSDNNYEYGIIPNSAAPKFSYMFLNNSFTFADAYPSIYNYFAATFGNGYPSMKKNYSMHVVAAVDVFD